jgi:hypothetical protein
VGRNITALALRVDAPRQDVPVVDTGTTNKTVQNVIVTKNILCTFEIRGVIQSYANQR